MSLLNLAGSSLSGGNSGVIFQITGIEAAIRNISAIALKEQAYVKKQIAIAAINVQREAKRNCPVDTGRLRASIRFESLNDGYAAMVYSDVKYADYVEYGTGIYANNGQGRRTPWMYFSNKYGWVKTRGQKANMMVNNAWITERPELMKRLSLFGGL